MSLVERWPRGRALPCFSALMMGLALAMSNQILFAIFAAMGVAGFGLVLWSSALEIWAHRPGAPSRQHREHSSHGTPSDPGCICIIAALALPQCSQVDRSGSSSRSSLRH